MARRRGIGRCCAESGAASSASSLPLAGEGWGGGSETFGRATFAIRWTPTPSPSPQGGGERTARVAARRRNSPPYSSSFNLYRMILPEPVRGIASIRCTALGTL